MIAVIKVGGHQALVQAGDVVEIDKQNGQIGDTVEFPVYLLSETDGTGFQCGTPMIDGQMVKAKIVDQTRGPKIRVFKMKPRKRYRRNLGFKAHYTVIEILEVGGQKAKTSKAEAPKKAESKEKAAPKAKKVKADDLTKIEGIGPKIAETLKGAGVDTYTKLSETDPAKISEMIAEVRGSHDPTTWPQQAELAATDRWDELKTLQDELMGGKAE